MEERRIVSLLSEAEREVLVETLDPLRGAQRRNIERGGRISLHLARERESAAASAEDPTEENPALRRVELAEQLLPLARDAASRIGQLAEGDDREAVARDAEALIAVLGPAPSS